MVNFSGAMPAGNKCVLSIIRFGSPEGFADLTCSGFALVLFGPYLV